MAENFDVDGRLNEAMPAVSNTQKYVSAAAKVGYQNPDLTLNGRQVVDWYEFDRGMDLTKLGADKSLIEGAAGNLDDAVKALRAQAARLADMWAGDGATAANTFITGHNDTAAGVASSVRTTATNLDALRNSLWQIVNSKVTAAQLADQVVGPHRQQWDSAATALAGGGGKADSAHEIANDEIKPYVESVIATRWLDVMKGKDGHSTGAAYDLMINALNGKAKPDFKVPGQLGPEYSGGDNAKPGDPVKPDNTGPAGGSPAGGAPPSSPNRGGGGGSGAGGGGGTDAPASPGSSGNQAGPSPGTQMSPSAGPYGQQPAGNSMGGMDPSQLLSGVTEPLTGAVGGFGQLIGGIAGALTQGLQSIPFDQMGQHGLGQDQHDLGQDGTAHETADRRPDDKTADQKNDESESADSKTDDGKKADDKTLTAGQEASTDGKPEQRHGLLSTGMGVSSPESAAGQLAPGAPGAPLGPAPGPGSVALATPGAGQPPTAAPVLQPAHPVPSPLSPLPSAGPEAPSAHPQSTIRADEGKTPCDIAADELPKAGQ